MAAAGPKRTVHPCLFPFFRLVFAAGCAVATAVISGEAVWALLVLPALPNLIVLGGRIADGHPTFDVEANERFSRILAGIGSDQTVALIVQDQTAGPVQKRRGEHPRLVAALGFVNSNTDEVLRGAGGLELASLQSPRMDRVNARVRSFFVLIIAAGLVFAFVAAPRGAVRVFAVLSIYPLTFWLYGVILAIWSRLDLAKKAFAEMDDGAARLVGATDVIDALIAMEAWRAAERDARSPIQRAAHWANQPILASAHTSSRVDRLQAYRVSKQP